MESGHLVSVLSHPPPLLLLHLRGNSSRGRYYPQWNITLVPVLPNRKVQEHFPTHRSHYNQYLHVRDLRLSQSKIYWCWFSGLWCHMSRYHCLEEHTSSILRPEDWGSMFLSNVGTYYKSSECYNLEDQQWQCFHGSETL